jgi:hypothetical protein
MRLPKGQGFDISHVNAPSLDSHRLSRWPLPCPCISVAAAKGAAMVHVESAIRILGVRLAFLRPPHRVRRP